MKRQATRDLVSMKPGISAEQGPPRPGHFLCWWPLSGRKGSIIMLCFCVGNYLVLLRPFGTVALYAGSTGRPSGLWLTVCPALSLVGSGADKSPAGPAGYLCCCHPWPWRWCVIQCFCCSVVSCSVGSGGKAASAVSPDGGKVRLCWAAGWNGRWELVWG